MKKALNIISILLFIGILTVPSLIWGIKLLTGSDRFEVEIEENRASAKWPEEFTPDVTTKIEAYYNDRVPFRSVLLHTYSVCDGQLEGFYRKNLQPTLIAFSGKKSNIDNTNLAKRFNDENEKADAANGKNNGKSDGNGKGMNDGEGTGHEDGTGTEGGNGTDSGGDEKSSDGVHEHIFVKEEVTEPTYLRYGYTLYRCEICGLTKKADYTEKLIDDSYLPETIVNNQVIPGRFNWLFFAGMNSRGYYQGTNVMDEPTMYARMNRMKEVKDICDSQGKTIVYVIWPNKEQVYPEYMPSYEIVNPVKREPAMKQYVDVNSDVTFLYPLDDLLMGKLFGDTYYPYDTHWNNLGAFIGTMSLYEALGLKTADLKDTEITEIPCEARGLVGTGLLDPAAYTDDCDYDVSYRPDAGVAYTEGNRLLTGGYTPVYRANASDPLYEKRFVIIGDSFRISMLSYLEKDFAALTAVQREDMESVSDDIKNADIIVMSAVERFDNDFYDKLDVLKKCLTEESVTEENVSE